MLNFGSKVNAMTLAHTAKLSLELRKTNVSAQKIDEFSLKTYDMVIAAF